MRNLKTKHTLALAVATVGIGAAQAMAASLTWDGGGGDLNWNTATNWNSDTLPTSADTVLFTSAGVAAAPTVTTISLGASQTIKEFRINSFSNVTPLTIGSAADISAGNTLTLTNVYRGDNNGNTQTLAARVKLAADSTWMIINGYNNTIAVTGPIVSDAAVTFTKDGSNSLTLNGANTFTGGYRVLAGSISLGGTNANISTVTASGGSATLNFNAGTAPTSNIVSSSTALTLGGVRGGGSVDAVGKNGNSVSQTFASTTLNAGTSSFTIANGNTANTRTAVNVGTISHNAGGVANFVQPTGTGNSTVAANNGFATSNSNDATGIIGAYAIVAGSDWATNNGTNVVAYSGYNTVTDASPTIANDANANVRINNTSTLGISLAGSGTTNINTLMYNDTASRTVTVGAGNTLRLGTVGGILKSGTGTATIDGGKITAGATDNSAGELIVHTTNPITINSEVADNGTGKVSLTKSGTGLLVLSSVGTYTGTTYVNQGVLAFNGTNASTVTSMGATTTSITVQNATGMAIGQTISGSNIPNGTRITNISGNVLTISNATTNSSSASNVAVAAYIGATGSRLSETGDIVVAGGTLEFGNTSATQLTSGNVVLASGILSNGTLTKNGGSIDARSGTIYTKLAGTTGITKTTPGTLTLANYGSNTFTGDVVITEGAVVGNSTATNVISISGNLTIGSASGGNAASYSNGTANGILANRTITVYSNGSLNTGSPAQSLTGTIEILGGSVTGSQIYSASSTVWNLTGGTLTGAIYNADATFNIKSSSTTSTIGATFNLNETFNVADGSAATDLLFSGTMSGAKNMTKQGTGLMRVTGSNAHTGITNISAGTLSATTLAAGGSNSSIGAGAVAATNLLIGNGATLQYVGTGHSTNRLFTVNGTAQGHGATLDASGAGAMTFNGSGSIAWGTTGTNQSRVLTLAGTSTADNTLGLTINNNTGTGATVALSKTGAGKWILTGTNGYTGATSITDGTLLIASGASLAGTTVTVNGASAVLGGGGTIGGPTTITDGTLSPGASVGTLTFGGNLTINDTLKAELDASNGTADKIVVGGALTIGADAILDLSLLNGTELQEDAYVIATYGSLTTGSVFAQANILNMPSGYELNYQYNDLNQIAVVAVPEPATLSVLALGAFGMLRRRQRA